MKLPSLISRYCIFVMMFLPLVANSESSLLFNGGAELGSGSIPFGWEEINNETGEPRNDNAAHSGDYSLKLVRIDTAARARWWSQPIGLNGAQVQSFRVSGWATTKNVQLSADVGFRVRVEFTDGTYVWERVTFPEGDFAWTQRSATFSYEQTISRIQLAATLYNSTGNVWFDDIEISVPNLLVNSSAEVGDQGMPLGWENVNNDTSEPQNDNEAYSGTYSFKIYTSEGKRARWRSTPIEFVETHPTALRISGWSKASKISGSDEDKALRIRVDFTDGTYDWLKMSLPAGDYDWTNISEDFTFETPIASVSLNAAFYNGVGNVWFDDLEVHAFVGNDSPAVPDDEPSPTDAPLIFLDGETGGSAEDLNGAVVREKIRVQLNDVAGSISRVDYYLDDRRRSGAAWNRTSRSPYRFSGLRVSDSHVLNTRGLMDGDHTITARVLLNSGSTEIYHATFRVSNGDAPVASPCHVQPTSEYGAEANNTCNPLGGGSGYSDIVSQQQATVVVSTKTALIRELRNARPGDIVYVDDDARIDLTGEVDLPIHAGVTLASGRGQGSSRGALLYTRSKNLSKSRNKTLFTVSGLRGRITGVRIRGGYNRSEPWPYEPYYYDLKLRTRGIYAADNSYLEVDNVEVYGFNHAAVMLGHGYVHHSKIYRNHMEGLGYGVATREGKGVVIEASWFDRNRHSLKSEGGPEIQYEGRYNWIGENRIGHAIDMHEYYIYQDSGGCFTYSNGDYPSGYYINIHHNTVEANRNEAAVGIRGRPYVESHVYKNWFKNSINNSRDPIRQKNGTRNLRVWDNLIGESAQLFETGPLDRWSGSVGRCDRHKGN